MANLTVTIDDDVLLEARIRALKQGTSVNALLRDHLARYVGVVGGQTVVAQAVLEMASASTARRGGRRWTRDELHERSPG